ncbi:MAG TPA: 50S ribosomal protein L24 [Chthoniobacteraceae bacterium]|nr:50S ribosomal protein L24 [Chthoniobacteraceae bacterium]
MNRPKFHVKKGDHVQVITGNHRGAKGKILAVLPSKSQVIIEGVRLIKKHTKRSQENQQGGIIEREGPIHISNVKAVAAEAPAPKAKAAKKPAKKKD